MNNFFKYTIHVLLLLLSASNVNATNYKFNYYSKSDAQNACVTRYHEILAKNTTDVRGCDWHSSGTYWDVTYKKTGETGTFHDAYKYIYQDLAHSGGLSYSASEARQKCLSYPQTWPYECVESSSSSPDSYTHTREWGGNVLCDHNYRWLSNTAPTLTTYWGDEIEIEVGEEYTLSVTADDSHEINLEYGAKWYVGGTIKENGRSYKFSSNSSGVYAITVKVTDEKGLTTEASVNITVLAQLPTLTIETPENNSEHAFDQEILFSAKAIDEGNNGTDISASILWTNTSDNSFLGQGASISFLPDEDGTYVISAKVTDSVGKTAENTIAINVVAYPTVSIAAPTDNSVFPIGQAIMFSGSAVDVANHDADISENIQWTNTTLEQSLGQGANVSFTPEIVGSYLVTAQVSDSQGTESELQTVNIVVKEIAEVSIVTPSTNDKFLHNEIVQFSSISTFDGSLTETVWNSNIDGELGTGAILELSNLSAGIHTITATSTPTDGADLAGSDTVIIDISTDEADENLADEEACSGQSFGGNPINLQTGNKVQREIDYISNGRFPLSIQRVYNSKSTHSGLFGPNWASNFEQSITLENDNQTAVIRKMSGAVERFNLEGGNWISSKPSQVSRNSLTSTADGWLYSLKDGSGETYNSQGLITKITTVDGYSQTYDYVSGQLSTVTDDANRTLTLAYENGFINTVTTPDGKRYDYGYGLDLTNTESHLISLTYPSVEVDGSPFVGSKTYLYEKTDYPHALTGLTDETNQRFATWGYDDKGRAIYSGHGAGSLSKDGFEDFNIEYRSENETKTTNAFGKGTTYTYESIDGILKTTEIKGHVTSNCSAASQGMNYYAENGWVKDRLDSNGNITTYTYNDRGLVTTSKTYWIKTLNPSGNYTGEIPTYFDGDYSDLTPDYEESTSWHPTLPKPNVVIKPGLTIDYDYYENGLIKDVTQSSTRVLAPETGLQTEFADRVWHYDYTYHAGFRVATMTVDGPRTDVVDVTTYHYDAVGNTTHEINALSHSRTFGHVRADTPYDWVIDENNVRTDHTFNDRGWLTALTVSKGSEQVVEDYQYYAHGLVKQKNMANGDSETYEYNSARYLTAKENSLGERYVIAPALDGGWLAKTIYDADGAVQFQQSRVPDALGRTLSLSGANGQHSSFQYDDNGNVTKQTIKRSSAKDLEIDVSYDWFNRVTDEVPYTFPENAASTHYIYEYGQLASVTRQAINSSLQPVKTTTYLHNGFGDLVKEQSPDRGSRFYGYSLTSNLMTSQTDGRGMTETRIYDELNRLTDKQFVNTAENQHFIYDQVVNGSVGIGKLGTVQDAVGTATYQYDYLGNLTNHGYQVGSNNYSVGYNYDDAGQLHHMIYPSGRRVDFQRDNLGRVNQVQETTSASVQYLASGITYKAFGPMSHINYGNGIEDDFSYDTSYRLTTNGQWANYQYNEANQVTYAFGQMAHQGGVSYDYDKQGRLYTVNWPISPITKEHQPENATGELISIDYYYDHFGSLLDRYFDGSDMHSYPLAPIGDRASTLFTWARVSDELEYSTGTHKLATTTNIDWRLASETTDSQVYPGVQTDYIYDPAGNLTSRNKSAVGSPTSGVLTGASSEVLSYNHAGRLHQVEHDGEVVSEYLYNSQGQRVNTVKNGVSVDYHFDQAGQLIAETDESGALLKEYVYLNGKPLVVFDNSVRSDSPQWYDVSGTPLSAGQSENLEAGVDVENSYLTSMKGDGSLILKLDGNGSTQQSGATAISLLLMDGQDSVVEVALAAELKFVPIPMNDLSVPLPIKLNEHIELTVQGNTIQVTEQYDWVKLSREGDTFTLYGSNNGGTSWTVISTNQLIAAEELVLQATALNATMDLSDMSVAEVIDPTFYMHNDHIGTTRIMTNSDGVAIWKSDLAPYGESFEAEFMAGNLNVAATATSLENSQRFPGQYSDTETGFNYNYFRDYDPQTARYIQSDPIGLKGGLNTYAYVGGDPINMVDPSGLVVEPDPNYVGIPYVDNMIFGTAVHAHVGNQLTSSNPGYRSNISYAPLFFGQGKKGGSLRADIIDPAGRRLWELKPLSGGTGASYSSAYAQLQGYCASASNNSGQNWTAGSSYDLLGAESVNMGNMSFYDGSSWNITAHADPNDSSGLFFYSAEQVGSRGSTYADKVNKAAEDLVNNPFVQNYPLILPGPKGGRVLQ